MILNDVPWELKREHTVIFEVAPKYCILDSFDYESHSISSKGFLPIVVDKLAI